MDPDHSQAEAYADLELDLQGNIDPPTTDAATSAGRLGRSPVQMGSTKCLRDLENPTKLISD